MRPTATKYSTKVENRRVDDKIKEKLRTRDRKAAVFNFEEFRLVCLDGGGACAHTCRVAAFSRASISARAAAAWALFSATSAAFLKASI
jgi:hypothetical protein